MKCFNCGVIYDGAEEDWVDFMYDHPKVCAGKDKTIAEVLEENIEEIEAMVKKKKE